MANLLGPNMVEINAQEFSAKFQSKKEVGISLLHLPISSSFESHLPVGK